MKKNYCFEWESKIPIVIKLLRVMKLASFLLLVSAISVLANKTYSQSKTLSLNLEKATIKEVLSNIEDQSGFSFMYSEKIIDVSRRVSISVENQDIESVLNSLFEGTDVDYKKIDRIIILSKSDTYNTIVDENSQQKAISGKVADSTGSPLPGVSIIIKGTTAGAISDTNGRFLLSDVPVDATLVFSFVGMKTQEIQIGGKTSIDVVMDEDAIGIEEVVAIGYGTQKKVNLTGSISSVSSDELDKSPVQNPLQSLQGKAPGLEIIQNSGEPGNEGYLIRIRGLNSYGSSNSPLIIVDGVVSSLRLINPMDIESVSVLKDASSSAIYGARAANGVILITTKSGRVEPMSLTYKANLAIHSPIMPFDFMEFDTSVDFMEYYNKIIDDTEALGIAAASNKYSQEAINMYKSNPDAYPNFDWLDYMMQSPLVMNHHLGVAGGTEKAKYDVSLGYFDQSGILKGYNYEKYTGKIKFDFKVNDYIDFGTNVLLGYGFRDGAFLNARDTWWCTLIQRPTYTPKLPDGRWTYSAFTNEYTNKNPALTTDRDAAGYEHTYSYDVLASAYLRIKFLKNFSWDITGATNYSRTDVKAHQKVVPQYILHTGDYFMNWGKYTEVSVQDTWGKVMNNTLYSTLKYNTTIDGVHNINALVGYNQESYKYEDLIGYRRGFSSPNLDALSAGETGEMTANGSITDWALQSVFGRVNYDYNGKYLIEASFRYDGSSRFHPDYRWGFFPSFSAGWRMSEEDFIKQLSWVDNLKIRASWGQLGNQDIGSYPYQNTLSLGNNYPFSTTEVSQGAYYSSFKNKKISWETTEIKNLGFDISIYKGLFSVNLDLYQKNTFDIIRGFQVPASLGFSGPTVNGGKMKNTGYELILGHSNKIKEVKYQVNLTVSHFKNTLVDYGARYIKNRYINEAGLPYQSYYMHEFDGIFQDEAEVESAATHPYAIYPGAIRLKDQNDDGVINGDDRRVFSGAYPKFDGGVNLAIQYKNFDFSAFVYGVYGKKFWGNTLGMWPFYQGIRPVKAWEGAWTEENHSNELPMLTYNAVSVPAIKYKSSFYLMDTSYLRLKNLQIGYNLPAMFAQKIGLKSLRVYFSGQNLFTIHNMKFGGDPEMVDNDAWNVSYPQVKVYSLGLDVKF